MRIHNYNEWENRINCRKKQTRDLFRSPLFNFTDFIVGQIFSHEYLDRSSIKLEPWICAN